MINAFNRGGGIWALLFWGFLAFVQAAQAQSYSYRADTFSYDTPSASALTVAWHPTTETACSGFPNGDDDYADITFASATTPANDFTFTFAGVVRTGARIYSNGVIVFGADNSGFWRSYNNTTLPAGIPAAYTTPGGIVCPRAQPTNMIMPYWNDNVAGTADATTGASVQYELLGTAPNRRLVISWVNVKLYGATARYNFQVLLYETPTTGGNSSFKFQYTSGSSDGSDATVGVQVSTTDYSLYSVNQAYVDPKTGTAILWYPSTQYTGKAAEYRFDELTWTGAAGEVKDTSSGLNNASVVNVGASGVSSSATGKICRGGAFAANTSNTIRSAVATPMVPAADGAIDFWYRSNVAWNAGASNAMLFDATTQAARPFYLLKNASGALRFSVTDSAGTVITVTSPNQTFAASTWQHVGVTWNLQAGTNQTVIRIFLNGALVQTNRTTSSGALHASLSTIYIGDNRTSGVKPSGGSPNSANGLIDEVNIYNTEINAAQAANDMNATRPSCTSVDHFHIVHGGTQVNCDVANVTIEAHDSAHTLIPLAGTVINLTTSTAHGDWQLVSGSGAVTNAGNGSGSYTFSNESSVTLGLTNNFVESTNINVTAGTYTESSGTAATCVPADYTYGTTCDTNLVFTQSGFRFVDASGNSIANQVAGATSGTYYLQAVKNTCTAAGPCTGVCTSLFPAATAVDIGLAYECRDPTTCQAGQTLTFTPDVASGTAGTIKGNNNTLVSESTAAGTYTSKSLKFNSTSPNPLPAVPFTFNYSDVGKIRFWARYPATSASPTVFGSSGEFVVKPAGFVLSEIKPTSNPSGRCAVATTPAPSITCASTAASNALFVRAGEAFSVTVTAVNANGAATPNYGQEAVQETVGLAPSKVLAAMISVPAVNGTFGGFSGGSATGAGFTWGEVGIITLTPSVGDNNYLGAGNVVGTTSGNIGRFIPDHIDTAVTDACPSGVYSYSSQPFGLSLTARNLAGATTVNYDATVALSRAVTLSQSQTTGSFSPAAVPANSFASGVSSASPGFAFATLPTAPVTITVSGQDADGVGLVASSVVGSKRTTNIRAGRLYLQNAYGSEFLPLPVPVQTQYWDKGWRQNLVDNCSLLTQPTAANSGLVFGVASDRNQLVSGEVVAQMNGSTAASVLVTQGNAKLVLRHPTISTQGAGDGNFGYVDVMGSVLAGSLSAWLPPVTKARACFGSCGPRSPVIYSREVF